MKIILYGKLKLVLDDGTGIQVEQKLNEGLNEVYPFEGVILKAEDDYKIYSKLPKLLFKSTPDQIGGISLIINGTQNRIVDKPVKEFKLSDDLKAIGYLVDLSEFITSEGLYDLALSLPKMHMKRPLDKIAYIKNFDYKFVNAPYIFEEEGNKSI